MKDSSKLSSWLVNNLDIPFKRYDTSELKQKYPHSNGIEFPQLKDLDVTISIGIDHADLLLHREFLVGRDGEPMGVKMKFGWVLMGGNKHNRGKGSCNFLCGNSSSTIDQNVQNFWKLESYGTLPKVLSELLRPDEKRSLNILEETTDIKDNRVETGLLWRSDVPHLPADQKMAINRLESLEKKFQKNPDFAKLCYGQIEKYIKLGHTRQLTKEEAKCNSAITNYIPHHGVLNINKPGRVRVVFDASAKFHNTSLNDNLLPGVDFLNNLISVLLRFKEGRFAVIADIEKVLHQVRVRLKDTDALRFLWRANPQDDIKDYVVLVHIFGEVDSPCCANWALRKTKPKNLPDAKQVIERDFNMDDFLKSLFNVDELIELSKRVFPLYYHTDFV